MPALRMLRSGSVIRADSQPCFHLVHKCSRSLRGAEVSVVMSNDTTADAISFRDAEEKLCQAELRVYDVALHGVKGTLCSFNISEKVPPRPRVLYFTLSMLFSGGL